MMMVRRTATRDTRKGRHVRPRTLRTTLRLVGKTLRLARRRRPSHSSPPATETTTGPSSLEVLFSGIAWWI